MNDEQAGYHRQLEGAEELISLTWCQGKTVDDVAVVLGARDDRVVMLDWNGADEAAYEIHEDEGIPCTALIGPLGEWVLTCEMEAGWRAKDRLAELSAEGRALALFVGPTLCVFQYAIAGESVTRLVSYGPASREGTQPDALDALIRDLTWNDDREFASAGLTLAERLTGERFTGDWYAGRNRFIVYDPD
ncbi:DUF6461 domain-containing protein [Herbidospora daliensis]|uniref:DUF6461 domain-containing protein n=1 Tax=Herbidospora daliensis TaxID=295585 RepID=UPI00078410AA|nr:DUF6461 domain-containing protein [Herbidospora daliensis]